MGKGKKKIKNFLQTGCLTTLKFQQRQVKTGCLAILKILLQVQTGCLTTSTQGGVGDRASLNGARSGGGRASRLGWAGLSHNGTLLKA